MTEPMPTVSRNPEIQARYERMRHSGESHSMAEMLACRAFPALRGTDSVFLRGKPLGGGQFAGDGIVAKAYAEEAAKAGVSTAGRYYMGKLARFPGDPEAWVSGTGDVKRICEQRGWGCSGQVNVQQPRYKDTPSPLGGPYRVADDIVDRHVEQRLAQDPGLASKREEVREAVATQLSGHGGSR
jgi:hypothetical protein